ncbi:MAG: sulfotransferase [Chloroflexota bacterium]
MNNRHPVFITGVQRSGTTLLSAMLAAHSRMSCGPETHFFQRLAGENIDQLIDPKGWPEKGKNFICSISYSNFTGQSNRRISILEKYQVTEQQIDEFLREQEPSISSLLKSVVEPYMQRQGKSRWVEKTPDHLLYLEIIRTTFPNSPIIRILRDPRDVALSLLKVPWGAKTFFEAIEYWKFMDEKSREFFEKDENSYTLRYEDLIDNPERELRKLCTFIGEDFEYAMLDTSSTGKQVNSQNVPWKKKVEQPIDKNRAGGWKHELSRELNQYTEAMIGDRLLCYGYPLLENFPHYGMFILSQQALHQYGNGVSKIAAQGIRVWKKNPQETPYAKLIVGNPLNKKGLFDRIRAISAIILTVFQSLWKGEKIFWISESEELKTRGFGFSLLKLVLNSYRIGN